VVNLVFGLNAQRAHAALQGIVTQGAALGKAFKQIRPEMKVDQRDHAKAKEGPEAAWPPRAASTLEKLKANGKRSRRPLGRLLSAIEYRATAKGVTGTSKIKWSSVFITGGTVGRGSKLPARPFLWISNSLLMKAGEILKAHLLERFK
jgi:hypothetical protein